MASPQKRAEIVFEASVQSRAKPQANGTIPFGGFPLQATAHEGLFFQLGQVIEAIPAWSYYPWARDRMLRAFYKTEPIMSGAVYSLGARIKSLDYKLIGREELHHELDWMLKLADYGAGFSTLVSKTITDISTQDNGAFWELLGDGAADSELLGGVALGVNYLDPAQCYRTFDPEFPVLYIDPLNGIRHQIHHTRVVMLSSMPQPNELSRNVGFSPLSRALLSVQLIQSIQQYRYEKSSGQFERAVGYGTGMTMATLKSLLEQSALEDENAGFVRFGKIPFFVSPRKEVSLDILDLASIPDGFDLMDEMQVYIYTISNAFGVDAREFWAATQTGATKADAEIQNLKSRGKGMADLLTIIEDAVNAHLMPDGVEFSYDFIDEEHDKAVAQAFQIKTGYLSEIKKNGGLSDEQYQAMLIHEGILPEDILLEAEQIAVMPEIEDETPVEPDFPMEGINPLDDSVNLEFDPNLEEMEAKSLESYRRELRSIMRGVIEGAFVVPTAVSATDSAVRRAMTQAAIEGLAAGGIRQGDMTQDELTTLQNIIFNEQDFVVGLVEFAATQTGKENPAFSAVFNRVDQWANRYDMVKDRFTAIAKANKKLKWIRDPEKDNCIDCITYDGRVYRGKTWEKHNIRPKMWELTCTGGHCGCGFKETDEPANRGFPPQPRGKNKAMGLV